ncbi:MAG TPA: hypothetical protein PK765_00515 [bacterium]|nr:hypothetical protein [bacterium]
MFLAVCGVVSTLATESLVIDGANIGLLFSVGFDAVALVLLFGSDSNAWFRAVASSKGA